MKGFTIGFAASDAEPIGLDELVARVEDRIASRPLVLGPRPRPDREGRGDQRRRVRVRGGRRRAGADCFLTGEPSEQAKWAADEAGIHFIAAGHYATEVFGVRALGDLVAERFGVEHVFIDVPNPV